MFTLAMSYTHHATLRLEELAGLALVIGGALSLIGAIMPFGKRGGQALGGIFVIAAGVLLILAVRYGTNP